MANIASPRAPTEHPMVNIESRMAIIKPPMATIEALMATIQPRMADITSPYGDNYFGMAKIVWGGREGMTEIIFKARGCWVG
jgi:hypothetical protein